MALKSISQLLKEYDSFSVRSCRKMKFKGVGKKDVYNTTSPFEFNGREYILGRVESRDREDNSKVMFFKKSEDSYIPNKSIPIFKNLQDPFIFNFDNSIIIGGVKIKKTKDKLKWRTIFYQTKNFKSIKKLFNGPWGMKGIRFIEYNNKIAIFTRPKTGNKNRKIGFTIINSLKELTSKNILQAPLIKNNFAEGEWGGVNQIIKLKNGKIGVLGHIANYSNGDGEGGGKNKNYYPIVFVFDVEKKEIQGLKIIARRKDLPSGSAKTSELQNVLYPGGIVRKDDGTAVLYVGASDAEAYEIVIDDPFLEFEN